MFVHTESLDFMRQFVFVDSLDGPTVKEGPRKFEVRIRCFEMYVGHALEVGSGRSAYIVVIVAVA
jgi:hypothetical protein